MVAVAFLVVVHDNHFVAGNLFDNAVLLADHNRAAILCGFKLHARADNRRFGHQQRHSLPLHVGAHQCAVSIVVFQEGDHGCSHGNHLSGTYVDVVHLFQRHFDDFSPVAYGYTLMYKAAILVERFICLCDFVKVLLVSGHIHDFFAYAVGFLIHTAVGGFDKAVFVDARIGRQRADQADVRAFRRLNGANTGVMAIMHIANLERRAITVQTARSQCG